MKHLLLSASLLVAATPGFSMGRQCIMLIDAKTGQCVAEPKTGLCLCERPTQSLPAAARDHGDGQAAPSRGAEKPDGETPGGGGETPVERDPVDDSGMFHPGMEPDRATNRAAWDGWREDMDRYNEANGKK